MRQGKEVGKGGRKRRYEKGKEEGGRRRRWEKDGEGGRRWRLKGIKMGMRRR